MIIIMMTVNKNKTNKKSKMNMTKSQTVYSTQVQTLTWFGSVHTLPYFFSPPPHIFHGLDANTADSTKHIDFTGSPSPELRALTCHNSAPQVDLHYDKNVHHYFQIKPTKQIYINVTYFFRIFTLQLCIFEFTLTSRHDQREYIFHYRIYLLTKVDIRLLSNTNWNRTRPCIHSHLSSITVLHYCSFTALFMSRQPNSFL